MTGVLTVGLPSVAVGAAIHSFLTPLTRKVGRVPGALHMNARPGQMPRRVVALLTDAVRLRYPLELPVTVVIATLAWTGEGVYDLQELLRLAG